MELRSKAIGHGEEGDQLAKHSTFYSDGRIELLGVLTDAGLSKKAAEAVASTPHRLVEVGTKRPFRVVGTANQEAIFVRSGIIAKYKEDAGRRQIVAVRFAGEGLLPRFNDATHGLQAITRSEVAVFQRQDLDVLLARIPEFAQFCVRQAQRNCAIGEEWLTSCGTRNSLGRIAHLFCETAVRNGSSAGAEVRFDNPFTQQHIAHMTGQTSVNVNRVIKDLEQQGFISRKGRELVIRDWDELTRLAGFDPAYLV